MSRDVPFGMALRMLFLSFGVFLGLSVQQTYCQDFVPVDILLLRFMNDLRHNLSSVLEEPKEEVKQFLEGQKQAMREFSGKLSQLESTLRSLQECCDAGKEDLAWSRKYCSRVARTCPGGWREFNESCYYVSLTSGTWYEGREYCQSLGTDYVKISSLAEWDFVTSLTDDIAWLGLHDAVEEGIFRWSSDDSLPEFHRWKSGEPNNYYEYEDCVVSLPSYNHYWNDVTCQETHKFICERSLESMYD